MGEELEEVQHQKVLIEAYRKRLRVLEIQAAKFGLWNNPSIQIEINDLTEKIQYCERKIKIQLEDRFDYSNKRKTILIIDDSSDDRHVVSFALSQTEFNINVIQADNGLEGLYLATEEQPDLILLDIRLPRIDGFEVLSHIKTRKIPTRVIMLTASREYDAVVKSIKLGACDYIVKPFEIEKLVDKVLVALEIENPIS